MTFFSVADDWQLHQENRLSEKLLFDPEEPMSPMELSLVHKDPVTTLLSHERALYREPSTSPTIYSQKMCIQLQITISLLAISISFIFCTLPNCISTIMIEANARNERVRVFWQAMNYFSIVPLLITHSVNLIFYYLSSNMFRERFKELYLQGN